MLFNTKRRLPDLSIIAIFFNMRREAMRTLHSLSRADQQIDENGRYEVLAIDNGSTMPLSTIAVRFLVRSSNIIAWIPKIRAPAQPSMGSWPMPNSITLWS
jgi:glycosyltransferase involved in cell wall biosynthesis